MDIELLPEERELIKLVNWFKKRGEILIIENKLGEEYKQMLDTCDKLVEQLNVHARNRATVMEERKQLQGLVREEARCPSCNSGAQLKLVGTEKNEKGWKSNKYRCRKCNITFVWNTPNNPWDMIPYVEDFIQRIESQISDDPQFAEQNKLSAAAMEQMKRNLNTLRPVVEASDRDFAELQQREEQMADLVHKFKKHLMIEKIRLED